MSGIAKTIFSIENDPIIATSPISKTHFIFSQHLKDCLKSRDSSVQMRVDVEERLIARKRQCTSSSESRQTVVRSFWISDVINSKRILEFKI